MIFTLNPPHGNQQSAESKAKENSSSPIITARREREMDPKRSRVWARISVACSPKRKNKPTAYSPYNIAPQFSSNLSYSCLAPKTIKQQSASIDAGNHNCDASKFLGRVERNRSCIRRQAQKETVRIEKPRSRNKFQ